MQVTLFEDDISIIKQQLQSLKQSLIDIALISPEKKEEVSQLISNLEQTLGIKSSNSFSPLKQDDISEKIDAYHKIQKQNRFISIWSDFKIDPVNFLNATPCNLDIHTITYESWGPKITKKFPKSLKNTSWIELWKILDSIIRESGDSHHVFIEAIQPDSKNKKSFHLVTGS